VVQQVGLRATKDVIAREVAGEAFLVPIRGKLADLQDLFVLNEVGQWAWSRLDGTRSVDHLVAGIMDEFEVPQEQARRDLEAFLSELKAAGLVDDPTVDDGE
jgi:Coenzyme PQQ synthesis protein D (PqqD)